MEVKLDKNYPLAVDMSSAWQLLCDVPAVAGCMPGAAITGQLDATHYTGTVKVKVGPASAAFGGDIEVRALDAASRTLQLFGKGADRGGSSASMELTAIVRPGDTPDSCVLVGQASVIVNGKFAQFGGRMMVQVSDMLLAQFVENFRVEATARAASAAASAAPPDATPALPGADATATGAMPAVAPARAQGQKEINGLAILWALIKGWFAGLFGRRA
ncbi:MAG: SRPBCC family protein [Pseudomonadota bacterium]|nr:SRPBCC family protein [Pseudomonadota bacterium]